LPNSADGKLYIRFGVALAANSYTASFLIDRPIYYHNGTKICEYDQEANEIIYKRPSSGTYVLKSVDGALSWVAE